MILDFFYRLGSGHEATMPGKAGRIVGSGAKKSRTGASTEHGFCALLQQLSYRPSHLLK
jgi:hypothetical protein